MKTICTLAILVVAFHGNGQTGVYFDSTRAFRERYINTHEVVLGDNRKSLRFFPIDSNYCVQTRFTPIAGSPWFRMETSGTIRKVFRVYGILNLVLHDTSFRLQVYQSQNLMDDPQFADYLFIPFTDQTTGEESYEAGRYIDVTTTEINSPGFRLDFNKAYNPYCAYISNKYNCPLPPKENNLPVAIKAGEMKYGILH